MKKFSEKIKLKKECDAKLFYHAASDIYNNLGTFAQMETHEENNPVVMEVEKICRFFHLEMPKVPKELTDKESILEFVMNENGMMRRSIVLTGKWWKEGAMPLLCSKEDGTIAALLPSGNGGYIYRENGKLVSLDEKKAQTFLREAEGFYKPLPQQAMNIKEFYFFLVQAVTVPDVVWLLGLSLAAGLLGMIMPALNKFLFHSVVPSGTSEQLFGICVLMIGTVIVSSFFSLARSVWVLRIGNKMELLAQNAVWSRLLSLPVTFFQKYDSGELMQRAVAVNQICQVLGGELIPTLLTCIFSVLYLFQISMISNDMLLPSLLIVLTVISLYLLEAWLEIKEAEHENQIQGKLSGLVFQLLNGITKIKAAGAQTRAFAKWAQTYRQLHMIPPRFLMISDACVHFLIFGGTMILYLNAYRIEMSTSDYIAFHSAFALFLGAVTQMADITRQFADLKPAADMLRPIMETAPENAGYKKHIEKLNGDIELYHVKFRYSQAAPYVLDDLKLQIHAGEYLGIVGSSGCGKSTLLKILLGFEKPESGSVYYDMKDMEGLDLKSVRRRIGVVLQNGKLFAGDIYSNIVICAPWLTVEEAWEAAERSGFAEDIRNMPMGMFTMISEGGGGLSGGQQQRLLIARALAAKPDILMFDEATSALDNITQALVVKTLEEMDCTRLVIAHRLSTIKKCSRIIFLHKGRILEEGTFEELMAQNGKFAEMARRQML